MKTKNFNAENKPDCDASHGIDFDLEGSNIYFKENSLIQNIFVCGLRGCITQKASPKKTPPPPKESSTQCTKYQSFRVILTKDNLISK